MPDHTITDQCGRTLGRIRDQGPSLDIVDAEGRRLGRYDKRTDLTTDAAGRTIGRGNQLARLLPPARR
jgi:hypothetical protein